MHIPVRQFKHYFERASKKSLVSLRNRKVSMKRQWTGHAAGPTDPSHPACPLPGPQRVPRSAGNATTSRYNDVHVVIRCRKTT